MANPEDITIRPGRRDDASPINDIYNHYVAHTSITFDIDPWDLPRRRQWIEHFQSPNFLLVAEHQGVVVGYANNGKFRPKAAYDSSTEVTVYTLPDCPIRGAGSALYRSLFEHIGTTSLHRAYAGIALPNETSVRFHEKFGFRHIGTLTEVGTKFGRRVDVAWFEKALIR